MVRDVLGASTVVVAVGELLTGEFDGETVILDPRDGVYYGLEGAGARIWQLLQRPTSVASVRDTLVAEYRVELRRCEADLVELLHHLLDRGLVRRADHSPGSDVA